MVGQTGKNFKSPMRINSTRFVLLLAAMSSLLTLTTCQDGPTPLTAEAPLHLEDHLDAAVITGSQVPSDVPKPVEWHFGESQPDWKVVRPLQQHIRPAEITRTKDSLRISLDQTNEMGIHLTQVTPRCRILGNGRLSPESGRVRGAFRQRAGLSGVSVSAPLAGGFSLSPMRA